MPRNIYKIEKRYNRIKEAEMITQNKKGFEMSINTIVILVIAVTMLILGIVLVKTIMCGAMNLAATTNEGAQAQINKLFSTEGGSEVSCMGTSNPIDIIPGRYNYLGCGFNAKSGKLYNYNYTLISAQTKESKTDIKADVLKSWIVDKSSLTGSTEIQAGQTGYGQFIIIPPEDADEAVLIFNYRITDKAGNIIGSTGKMTANVRRVGFVQNSIC